MKFNVAVLSTGFIAGVVSRAVLQSDKATLFCVASRSAEKAQQFVDALGEQAAATLALGSYDEAINHPEGKKRALLTSLLQLLLLTSA